MAQDAAVSMPDDTKLRLIAGTINHWPDGDGWRNVTIDVSGRGIWDRALNMPVLPSFVGSIVQMPQFREGMFDEIRCHHVLEHLTREEGDHAVSEFARILKPGGTLDIEVPDLDRVCAGYLDPDVDLDANGARQWLLGEQLPNHEDGDSHRFLYTEPELRDLITSHGLEAGDREDTGLALRLIATKP